MSASAKAVRMDLERLRVREELPAWEALLRNPLFQRANDNFPKYTDDMVRRALRANALHLSRALAPQLHDHLDTAMRALRLETPVELYEVTSEDPLHINAVIITGDTLFIQLYGALRRLAGPEELVAVFGHELGHAVLHRKYNDQLLRLWQQFGGTAGALAQQLMLSQEFSADRFALVASGSLDAWLRFELLARTREKVSSLAYDPRAYLEQCKHWVAELLGDRKGMQGITHPEHAARSYAAWLFSETEVFCDLVGKGIPRRSLRDAEDEVSALLHASTGVLQGEHNGGDETGMVSFLGRTVTAVQNVSDRVHSLKEGTKKSLQSLWGAQDEEAPAEEPEPTPEETDPWADRFAALEKKSREKKPE